MNKATKKILSILAIIAIISFLIIPVIKIGTGNNFINPMLESAEAQQVFSFAKNITSEIQSSDFVGLSKYYSQYFNENNIKNIVTNAELSLPTQSPDNIQLVGLRNIKNYNGLDIIEAALQYQFKNEWYIVTVTYSQQGDVTQLLNFYFNKLPDSLENINKVVFSKASILQYLVLALTIIIPIIILMALIMCIRASHLKRKWLWIIFIIFGVVGFYFNWTTQTFMIKPLNFQLLGAGYFRISCYSPLILTFSIPLGAIIFFVRQLLIFNKNR